MLHPVSDLEAWARLLLGVILALWLPGFWLVGRFVRGDWPQRLLLSLMAGILAVAGVAIAAAHTRLPFTLWTCLPLLAIAGLALGMWPAYRRSVAAVVGERLLISRRQLLIVAAICAALAATVVQIHGGFPVPPGVHDSGNHAFLALRIVETSHTDAGHIFADPYGQPQRPYYVGWHACAALVARCGGLPPYIAVWLFPLLALVLLPGSLLLVWREFRIARGAAIFAAAVLLVSENILVEIPWRGGWGQYIAMFCLPLPMMALVRAQRECHVGLATIAGLGLACMVWIHASWALVAVLFAAVAIARQRVDVRAANPIEWRMLGVTALAFFLVAMWDILPTLSIYRESAYRPKPLIPLADSVLQVTRCIGGWAPLQVLTAVAMFVGLWRRETRAVATLAALFALLAVALASVQDRVSLALGQPWYQVYFRLYRPQMFLLPPLVATLLWPLLSWHSARWPRWLGPAAAAIVAIVLFAPARLQLDNDKLTRRVMFSANDVQLAVRIARRVPEDAYIINWRSDGSCWAMHVSGRVFLQGSNWVLGVEEGRDYRVHIQHLLAGNMTAEVRALRDMNVGYLYATDRRAVDSPRVFNRDDLDRDPRFEPTVKGKHTTLYRIDWDRIDGGRRR